MSTAKDVVKLAMDISDKGNPISARRAEGTNTLQRAAINAGGGGGRGGRGKSGRGGGGRRGRQTAVNPGGHGGLDKQNADGETLYTLKEAFAIFEDARMQLKEQSDSLRHEEAVKEAVDLMSQTVSQPEPVAPEVETTEKKADDEGQKET